MIVTDAGWDAVDAAALSARDDRRAGFGLGAVSARGREMLSADGEVVWSGRLGAGVKLAEVLPARPGLTKP